MVVTCCEPPQDTPFPRPIRSSIALQSYSSGKLLIYIITHHSVGKLVKVLHSYVFEQIRIGNDKEWFRPKEHAETQGARNALNIMLPMCSSNYAHK